MISKKEIFLNSIKIVPEHSYGVYFLIAKNEIVYIGSSGISCEDRIRTHRSNRRMWFDRFYVLKMHTGYEEYEAKSIREYRPKYNIKDNPDFLEGKKPLWFGFLKFYSSWTDLSRHSKLSVAAVKRVVLNEGQSFCNNYEIIKRCIISRVPKNSTFFGYMVDFRNKRLPHR